MTKQNAFTREDLLRCSRGELFGPGNAQLPAPNMLMVDRITHISEEGGKYGKGELVAELDITPDLWFFACHFEGDPVMPGCLGLDAMWQLVGFFLGWQGLPGRGRALGSVPGGSWVGGGRLLRPRRVAPRGPADRCALVPEVEPRRASNRGVAARGAAPAGAPQCDVGRGHHVLRKIMGPHLDASLGHAGHRGVRRPQPKLRMLAPQLLLRGAYKGPERARLIKHGPRPGI